MDRIKQKGRAVVGVEDFLSDDSANVAGIAEQVAEKDNPTVLGIDAVLIESVEVFMESAPVLHGLRVQRLVALFVSS